MSKKKNTESKSEMIDLIQQAKDTIGEQALSIIEDHLGISFNKGVSNCPFHDDSTPSFVWNPKTSTAKCFGCGRMYSILDYLVEVKGSYKNALDELFRMAHIEKDMYAYRPFGTDSTDWFENYKYPTGEKEPTEDNVVKYFAKRSIGVDTLKYAGVQEDKYGNIAFPFEDIDGKLIAVKYRKSRASKKGEAKYWWQHDADAAPILYNVKKVDYTKPLVITEGMIDTLSLIEAGYLNVVSIPDGATSISWLEFNFEFLQNFSTVVLYFDNDKAGQEGLSKTIGRIGEYRCRIVKPTPEDEQMVEDFYEQLGVSGIRKTDANNILLACGKDRLLQLISRAEEIPTKHLKYLLDCEVTNVRDMECMSTGLESLDDILYGNLFPCFTVYSGYAGCVDADTEYFNGREWRRIADYSEGDKVLQYTESGRAELVAPEQYHKYEADSLWHFKTKYGIDQCLSDEHNVPYITSKGNLYSKQFKEVRESHNRNRCGFTGKFITTFDFDGDGIDLTDCEIKLMCAIICDGSFYGKYADYPSHSLYKRCRFHIKKDRKKEKLRELFTECKISWSESESKAEGYTDFYTYAPRREKEFYEYWYNCNKRQLQIITENVLFWDGHVDAKRKSFSTTSKMTADFIQFCFSACGYRSRISESNRVGQNYLTCGKFYLRKSIEYIVTFTKNNLTSMSSYHGEKAKIEKYDTTDGFKYCFTVPSHMWVMRRNGCIVVSGNSGKSSVCNLTSVISPLETGHKVFIFSGELDEGQLLSWILSPLAGINHTRVWDNDGGRKGYSVTEEAENVIRKYYRENIILYEADDELETSDDKLLEAMEIAYRKYGCDTFLIDNMMCLTFNQDGADSKWDAQKRFIIKLMNFTKKYGVNTNLVLHPKKPAAGQTTTSTSDLAGSSDIGNLVHRLLWVSRLKDDEEGYSVQVEVIKDRPSQAAGDVCKLYYDKATRRLYSDVGEYKKKFSWEKEFKPNYKDNVAKNLMCNRVDIMSMIPRNNGYGCDQM